MSDLLLAFHLALCISLTELTLTQYFYILVYLSLLLGFLLFI